MIDYYSACKSTHCQYTLKVSISLKSSLVSPNGETLKVQHGSLQQRASLPFKMTSKQRTYKYWSKIPVKNFGKMLFPRVSNLA